MKTNLQKLRVVELFAGVGGFRLGLEAATNGNGGYEVVWSNQWEPATRSQHASLTYINRFGEKSHSNTDIAKVPTNEIPNHDLLVGGFPCQDYSVARVLSHAKGLVGKKGVLWWQIHRILREKRSKAPSYLMLENVDRLVKSPASGRGRDFAIMLASLSDLGYAVEWRIINAADYGMPQRRRRIFIMGYKKGTEIYNRLAITPGLEWVLNDSPIARGFPVKPNSDAAKRNFTIIGDLDEIMNNENVFNPRKSPFLNCGLMVKRKVFTQQITPNYNGPYKTLGDILLKEHEVPPKFFISPRDLPRWRYLKGKKDEVRGGKRGMPFHYVEGPMAFPDPLDKPSRTIITGEGGSTPSRFKHVVGTSTGKYRRLTPVELERLCMFPDGHTEGNSDIKRAFLMGNALVVGVVERLGRSLLRAHLNSRNGRTDRSKIPIKPQKFSLISKLS